MCLNRSIDRRQSWTFVGTMLTKVSNKVVLLDTRPVLLLKWLKSIKQISSTVARSEDDFERAIRENKEGYYER